MTENIYCTRNRAALTHRLKLWPRQTSSSKIRRAFVLDLPDTVSLKHEIQDQDSWKGGTGRADSTAQVTFQRGFPSVTCRRLCLVCKGVYACLSIDTALLDVEHHDLDPAAQLRVFAAQKATCMDEKSSV